MEKQRINLISLKKKNKINHLIYSKNNIILINQKYLITIP